MSTGLISHKIEIRHPPQKHRGPGIYAQARLILVIAQRAALLLRLLLGLRLRCIRWSGCARYRWNGRGLLHLLWLRLRRALLFLAEARLVFTFGGVFLLLFCRSVPIQAQGSRLRLPVGNLSCSRRKGCIGVHRHFALLRLLDAGAVAIARLVCRRSGFKWIGGRLIRVGNCLRQRTRILRS